MRHWTHQVRPRMLDKGDVSAALADMDRRDRLRAQLLDAAGRLVDLARCALCNVERAVCDIASDAAGKPVCHPCGRKLIDTETELALCGHPFDVGAIR